MTRGLSAPALVVAGMMLGSCGMLPSFLGETEGTPLPGDRISILALERTLEPDPRLADLEVRLPRPWLNVDWPQAGGYANHAMHHLELPADIAQAWEADIGAASDSERRISSSPVIADGKLFAMDARATVSAFDAESGAQLWRIDLTPDGEEAGTIGGGVAYDRGRLYATTGYGEVFALDPQDGKEIWKRRIGVPLRAAPTIDGNRVFAVTYDNQLYALDTETGAVAWNHVGITESAGLLGAASPPADGGIVIAPYSSGELFALRGDNGVVAWSDQLVRTGRISSVGAINDISGRPVIDRGRVFAIGHAGRMISIDLRSGERVWDREIAGLQMPWVSGEFIFVVTLDGEIACLSRRDGRVRWVRQLQRYENPESTRDKGSVTWLGPVLAGDRLLLVSSHGQALSVSPYTGEILGQVELPAPAAVAPVVANRTVYILCSDATLLAFR